MPNQMKIQPVNSIDDLETEVEQARADLGKPVFKSLLRRLFDRQFQSVVKISSVATAVETQQWSPVVKDEVPVAGGCGGGEQFEPSSLCLEKMVHNFIEEINEKQQNTSVKCGGNRCNCFNAKSNDSSDDEADVSLALPDSVSVSSPIDFTDFLKSLISCRSIAERNLLADTSRIVEKNKLIKRKCDLRTVVVDGLSSTGYDASICKSRWDKSPTYPAGEYEYIDVNVDGERVIIDVDFRSEFEIARSTGSYKAILQLVPYIFVGKADRLQQIVSIVCEAARQSLKKKGMPFPPWRKAEYMRCKWLAAHTRAKSKASDEESVEGELELIFGNEDDEEEEEVVVERGATGGAKVESGEVEVTKKPWHPPPIKPKSCTGKRVVTGLSFLLKDSKSFEP